LAHCCVAICALGAGLLTAHVQGVRLERIPTMKLFADNGSAVLNGQNPATTLFAAAKWTAGKVAAPVRAYLQRDRIYRELTELDDRMLADIGIDRGDIHAVARGCFRP